MVTILVNLRLQATTDDLFRGLINLLEKDLQQLE